MAADNPEAFAQKTTIGQTFASENAEMIRVSTAKINARCFDLLSVEVACTQELPDGTMRQDYPYESHRITFLHRTIADFPAEDSVGQDLHVCSGSDFDPNAILFACYAFLVKKAPSLSNDFEPDAQFSAMQWSTYCPKLSIRQTTYDLVEDVDKGMAELYRSRGGAHWTNYIVSRRSPPGNTQDDYFPKARGPLHESTSRDFLGHLIDLGVAEQIKARVTATSLHSNSERGRCYLDYALRCDKAAVYRNIADSRFLAGPPVTYGTTMIETLFSLGCDVNQKVWIYDGRTVWDLHLAFMHDNRDEIDLESALAVTKLLIDAGAKDVPRCILSEELQESTAKYHEQSTRHKDLSMCQILEIVFGEEQGNRLAAEVKQSNTGGWFPWRFG